MTVEFFNVDAGRTSIDLTLFEDDRSGSTVFAFKILESQDISKKGAYPIGYKVYHSDYPDNFVEVMPAFTVNIIDQCDSPFSLVPMPLDDQVYTLTDTSFSIVAPSFIGTPDYCDIVYSVTVSNPTASTAFTFKPDSRKFTFHKDSDIIGGDVSQRDYTVTLWASIGTGSLPIEKRSSFTLTLRNPCVDPAFVTIEKVALPVGL